MEIRLSASCTACIRKPALLEWAEGCQEIEESLVSPEYKVTAGSLACAGILSQGTYRDRQLRRCMAEAAAPVVRQQVICSQSGAVASIAVEITPPPLNPGFFEPDLPGQPED